MDYQINLFPKSLQDLRNEIQEKSFKELAMMQITGFTFDFHMLQWVINKLDSEYGTVYQPTETVLKEREMNINYET